jgi:hypothetical protein
VPKAKLRPLSQGVVNEGGKGETVTVPLDDGPLPSPPTGLPAALEVASEKTAHTEIQWMLLKLGSDLGLD